MNSHDHSAQEAALDTAIRRAQRAAPSFRWTELPSEAVARAAIRDILCLPDTAPIEATAEELRLFGKVYCLMSLHNAKWLSVAQVGSPVDAEGNEREAVHRLISRIPEATEAERRHNPMAEHNEFVGWLYACIPESERITFDGLLRLINASEGIGTAMPSGLLPVMEAGGWYAVRACQDEVYRIPGCIKRRHAVPEGQFTSEDIEAQDITDRLAQFEGAMRTLPWRHLPAPHDVSPTSLFTRLLLHASFNRFLCVELGMDRVAKASAQLQHDVLKALTEARYASIGELIQRFQRPHGVDHLAMVSEALRNTVESAGRRLTPTLVRNIDEQADHILASCGRSEFIKDTVSRNLMADPVATKAVAWLLLTQAALTEATVFNEDPDVHAAQVRVISQRSALETHGHAMLLRRKAVSSILVSRQAHALSIRRWQQQAEYAQTVRLRCRDVLHRTFSAASVQTWQRIFDHFDLGQALGRHTEFTGKAAQPEKPDWTHCGPSSSKSTSAALIAHPYALLACPDVVLR